MPVQAEEKLHGVHHHLVTIGSKDILTKEIYMSFYQITGQEKKEKFQVYRQKDISSISKTLNS